MALNFSSNLIAAPAGCYGCSCSSIFCGDRRPPTPPPPSPAISPFYENVADLLPADPFGMGISAAISGVIDDLATTSNYLRFGDVRCRPKPGFAIEAPPQKDAEAPPHEGLFFALPYLELRDLLSMEMVCKSLNSAIRDDPFLWRCIHVDQPLNFIIKDDELIRLTRRAKGNIECLFLRECQFITDSCLGLVLLENLKLRKLSVPGCLKITINGLLNIIKNYKFKGGALKQLSLGRLYSIKHEQYGEFQALLGLKDGPLTASQKKPRFYHLRNSAYCGPRSDNTSLDVEPCPLCQCIRVIYDCSLHDGCNGPIGPCRACAACIPRCDECGRCIFDLNYEETFLLEWVCFPCMKYPTESQPLVIESQLTE